MASSGVFKPERGIITVNVFASLVIVGCGIGLALLGLGVPSLWVVVPSLALVLLGLWVGYRCLIVQVRFDESTLHVIGFVRTRRIPREAVLSVERWDVEMPMIQWSTAGTDRWSILTPLMLGQSRFLPASMYRRRHRFLAHLRQWAPDVDTSHVRPGLWSQLFDGLTRLTVTIVRSPVLRVGLAILAVALTVGAYAWGVSVTLSIIQGAYHPAAFRGLYAPIGIALPAAEAAYWLIPTRKPRPQSWQVILAAIMAPLAALTLAAFFT